VSQKRRRRDAIDNRAKVLAAAAEAFAEHGIATRIDHVTARAGVTAPTVYRHFGSRQGLLHAVLDARMADLAHQIDVVAPGPPPTRWTAVVRALATAVAHDRLLVRVALFADPEGRRSPAAQALDAVVERHLADARAAGLIARGVTATDIVVLLGAVDRLVELGDTSPAAVQRCAGLIVRALAPPAGRTVRGSGIAAT
jgi:AcrR family transcriptional regulator